jgi:hypothetical protein
VRHPLIKNVRPDTIERRPFTPAQPSLLVQELDGQYASEEVPPKMIEHGPEALANIEEWLARLRTAPPSGLDAWLAVIDGEPDHDTFLEAGLVFGDGIIRGQTPGAPGGLVQIRLEDGVVTAVYIQFAAVIWPFLFSRFGKGEETWACDAMSPTVSWTLLRSDGPVLMTAEHLLPDRVRVSLLARTPLGNEAPREKSEATPRGERSKRWWQFWT